MSALNQNFLRSRFRLMPNRQAVTYQQQTALGVYSVSYPIADAWYRDLTDAERAVSNGIYVGHERFWHLPRLQLTVNPAVGDLIVDGTSTYTVLTLGEAGGQGVWKLKAVDLVLAAGLRDAANIYTPTNTQDASGNRVPVYPTTPTYANVPCRVQEISGERTDIQGKRGALRQFTAYLGQRVFVTTETQVRVGGVTYQIKSWESPDRIDDLMHLSLELLP